jgi:hypothetical protein
MPDIKCLICNSNTEYFFSKTYSEPPIAEFMREIGDIHHHKCINCGFVISKTHSELSKSKWEKLNYDIHHYNEEYHPEELGTQPPYIEQALMLSILAKNGLIDIENTLDYAAGYGTLSELLLKYFNIKTSIFDKYVENKGLGRYLREDQLTKYKTVINSAMFEHVLNRSDLNIVNDLVAEDGCLILHTVICENIPKDPNWFYLTPVHTAFHTNKSMGILMNQWGYKSSIYCPTSKCWVLFKNEIDNLGEVIASINKEFITDFFYYKKGFVDYWKGF